MSSEIVWQDPPEVQQSKQFGEDFAAQLKANPGRWALYRADGTHGSNGATTAKRLGLERASRRNEDGTYSIYMRAPKAAQ